MYGRSHFFTGLHLLLVALACTVFWANQAAAQQQMNRHNEAQIISARAGVVSRVEGEAWYRRHGEKQWNVLQPAVTLSKGDTILTGKNGRAECTLNPGSYLQIDALSQVWVYETSLDRMHFDILRGEAFAIISALKDGVALVFDTPPAELNILKGGSYHVRVASDDGTEASVTLGKLRFINQGKVITLTKHKRVRFSAPERKKRWDMDTITVQQQEEREVLGAPSP